MAKRISVMNVITGCLFPGILTIPPNAFALPPAGYNKVAYYTFDATPVDQGFMSLTDFTDNATIVVVFEGTLWELADTVHYDTQWMRNRIYKSRKQILDDIRTLQERGILVLMNVDDAATWSTGTPFTTWDGKPYDYRQFAAFVDSCVDVVGFDGISLDVEHKAVDNEQYRNMIKEFGKYFGPLSSDPLTKMYIGAVYESRYGVPGEIFREEELSRYLNFVMDMGYTHEDGQRFDFWADHLGPEKVMPGMSHQDNRLENAVTWLSRHPAPETAGIMVYAANVNKNYTDSIFSALGDPPVRSDPKIMNRSYRTPLHIERCPDAFIFHFSIRSEAHVSLSIVAINGTVRRNIAENRFNSGEHAVRRDLSGKQLMNVPSGCYFAVLEVNGSTTAVPCITL